MKVDKNNIKKILVIKLRGIGDVILSTIVFDNLVDHYPQAKIDFLTEEPGSAVLKNLSVINKIHIFNRHNLAEIILLMWKVRKERYDLILDLFSNPSTAQITFLSGAKLRAGFPYKGRKYAYNLFGPSERNILHSADLHLKFLQMLGINIISNDLHFGLNEEDKAFAHKYFESTRVEKKLIFCLSPSGGWPSKKCDPLKFSEIGKALLKKYNAALFLIWGPGDESEAAEIKRLLGDNITVTPATSIGQMSAILAECDVVIANDSGPMHISTAVKTPTISLNGPTDPRLQGPYGSNHEWVRLETLPCIGCNLLVCNRNHECFLELPTDQVLNVVDRLLKKNNLHSRE